jgi:hypothetical protein
MPLPVSGYRTMPPVIKKILNNKILLLTSLRDWRH